MGGPFMRERYTYPQLTATVSICSINGKVLEAEYAFFSTAVIVWGQGGESMI